MTDTTRSPLAVPTREQQTPESYPTFWDYQGPASVADCRPHFESPSPTDAYAKFVDLVEEGQALSHASNRG